jgi:acyl transferase domain-containing protein/acyl carrier protein
VIEEAPAEESTKGAAAYPAEVVTVSAKTLEALAALCGRYAGYLREHPEVSLGDFAYTANACRTLFQHRTALTARTEADAAAQLEALSTGDLQRSPLYRFVTGYQAPPVAFLFTGQGSQYSGMGRAFYERSATFRDAIDRCDKVLAGRPYRLTSVIFGDGSAPKELIDDTAWTQPALFAVEYALAMLWASWGVRPSIVLGHSLGEYVAACVAGILTLEEALTLAAERGRLMSERPRSGSMLAVRTSEEALLAVVGRLPEGVSIAAYNGPQNLVLSGRSGAVGEMAQKLAAKGIVSQPLTVSHAFHSPLMEPMLDTFQGIAEKLTYRAPQIDFVSNVTGAVLRSEERTDAAYWRKHVREPVKLAQGLEAMVARKPALIVEVGPQPVLLGLAKTAYPEMKTPAIPTMRRGQDEWQTAYEALQQAYLAGAPVDWDGVYRNREKRRLVLPTYPFQRQRYWTTPAPRVAGAAAPAAAVEAHDQAFAPKLYQIGWPAQDVRVEAGGGADAALVIGEEAQTLTEALAVAGVAVLGLPAAEAAPFLSGSTAVEVDGNRAALRRALAEEPRPQAVVLLLPARCSAQDVPRAAHENATAILSLLQEVAGRESAPARVWLVTKGAFACEAGDGVDVTASVADAMQKVARLENPQLAIHHADLAQEPAAEDWRRLAGLVRHGTDEHTLAIRNGGVRVARLERYERPPQGSLSLRPEAAYLVTGAFGGLGLKTAEWLAGRGAKNLYLVGRHVPSEETQGAVVRMEAEGTRVHTVVADVSRAEEVARLGALLEFESADLRGIVHAAGTVDDGVIAQQTPERFETVFGPKVKGGWLLHEMSLRYPLDFFAMFGSASALLGLGGQANYAAANAFLDGLAALRHARGLPATSVAWGAWAEVGMATRVRITQRSTVIGIGNIAVKDGMRLQEQAILSGAATLAALPFHWKMFFASGTAHHDWPLLRRLAAETEEGETGTKSATLASLVKKATPAMRLETIRDYLKARILSLLMLPADFPLRDDQPFTELGLDSLMALELKNELQSSAGASLPPTFLFEYPDLAQASLYLNALARGVQDGELAEEQAGEYEEIEL